MKRLIPVLLAMVLALTMGFGVVYAEDTYPPTDEGVVPDILDPYDPDDLDDVMDGYGIECYGKIDNWDSEDPNGDHSFGTSVVINITANEEDGEYKTFSWESTVPIKIVLVKAATSALVYQYEYEYPVTNDSGLVAPEFKGISHVAFGWDCDDDNGGGQEVPIPGLNTWGTLAGMLLIGATGILVYRRRLLTA